MNDVQELDFKGPFYLKDRSQKYYLMVLRDKMSKKTALRALANKSMDAIVDFLVDAWQKIGCPKRLKMDNRLDFRGSNLYPGSPSKLMRVCLDLGVQPVFIPLREPWRSPCVTRGRWAGLDSAEEPEKTRSQKTACKTRRLPAVS